jgi:hypothetical protein
MARQQDAQAWSPDLMAVTLRKRSPLACSVTECGRNSCFGAKYCLHFQGLFACWFFLLPSALTSILRIKICLSETSAIFCQITRRHILERYSSWLVCIHVKKPHTDIHAHMHTCTHTDYRVKCVITTTNSGNQTVFGVPVGNFQSLFSLEWVTFINPKMYRGL